MNNNPVPPSRRRLVEKLMTMFRSEPESSAPLKRGEAAKPTRIGILLGDLKGLNEAALKYLTVHLNTLQKSFEFEFLPTDATDSLIRTASSDGRLSREDFRAQLIGFLLRAREYVARQNARMAQSELPDKFVLLMMAKFRDNAYTVDIPDLRVLALGDWNKEMAPPSLLEACLTLILRQAVALRGRSFTGNIHLGTKGCLFDYGLRLSDARFRILQGFVCSVCRDNLDRDGCG